MTSVCCARRFEAIRALTQNSWKFQNFQESKKQQSGIMPVFNKAERNILHVLLYSFIYQQILFDFLQALLFNGRERLSVLEATQKAIDMFKCM